MKRRQAIANIGMLILLLFLRLYRSYSSIDGISGMLWGALPGFDDTVYAPGYTDKGLQDD